MHRGELINRTENTPFSTAHLKLRSITSSFSDRFSSSMGASTRWNPLTVLVSFTAAAGRWIRTWLSIIRSGVRDSLLSATIPIILPKVGMVFVVGGSDGLY